MRPLYAFPFVFGAFLAWLLDFGAVGWAVMGIVALACALGFAVVVEDGDDW